MKLEKRISFEEKKEETSIDINARNGSAPNLLNWNTFIVIEYEYLATLVVVKNAVVIQNIWWQNFITDTKIGNSFKY